MGDGVDGVEKFQACGVVEGCAGPNTLPQSDGRVQRIGQFLSLETTKVHILRCQQPNDALNLPWLPGWSPRPQNLLQGPIARALPNQKSKGKQMLNATSAAQGYHHHNNKTREMQGKSTEIPNISTKRTQSQMDPLNAPSCCAITFCKVGSQERWPTVSDPSARLWVAARLPWETHVALFC